MKKDLEWLKEEVKRMQDSEEENKRWEHENGRKEALIYHDGREIAFGQILSRIDQVEQPTLPEIPDYVDNWLRDQRRYYELNIMVEEALSNVMHVANPRKEHVWIFNNIAIFIDAYRYGYTVEEKRYWVKLLDTEKGYLYINEFHSVIGRKEDSAAYQNKFTEKEIKEMNPDYWPFAKEVTE